MNSGNKTFRLYCEILEREGSMSTPANFHE